MKSLIKVDKQAWHKYLVMCRAFFKNVFYALVALGLLDMCVQMITDKKIRIIWLILDIFFDRP
jgi:mannose/fructose/N-acetylgalactosamine-specific phosphotransferase system component IID